MAQTVLKPAMLARLAHLDECLTWRGQANRKDLTARFGISPAQAAVDFREYLARCRAPAPTYDPARKCYVASVDHRGLGTHLVETSVAEVLSTGDADRFAALSGPARRCPAPIVRRLYQAMETGRRIEIVYVSMSTGASVTQWIAPAAIGSDGERLHFRAWSYRHQEWRDYLPVRISEDSTFAAAELDGPIPRDEEWESIVRIELRPRSDLSPAQRAAVRREYGFEGERLTVETCAALAFYLDRRWGLGLPNSRLERCSETEDRTEASTDERPLHASDGGDRDPQP